MVQLCRPVARSMGDTVGSVTTCTQWVGVMMDLACHVMEILVCHNTMAVEADLHVEKGGGGGHRLVCGSAEAVAGTSRGSVIHGDLHVRGCVVAGTGSVATT
ncbi:hypothetical protein EDB86DRAFT_2828485 [Lactarius hatsudake]|nr:hypothetical protein EDB86DRAFT_2828485 [Lactarius hatsudake]